MGKAIPSQHPAVVLRSHFKQVRALLAVAMIAVVGLTAAIVILALWVRSGPPVGSRFWRPARSHRAIKTVLQRISHYREFFVAWMRGASARRKRLRTPVVRVGRSDEPDF